MAPGRLINHYQRLVKKVTLQLIKKAWLMFSRYKYYRDPFLNQMLKAKPYIDPVVINTLPDQILSTFTPDVDESLDLRDDNPYPDVQVNLDRRPFHSMSLFRLKSADHLKYGYRYLESIHYHDDQDYEKGFVNYALPEGYGSLYSQGDFDEVILDSIRTNEDRIPVEMQRHENFDYSPLPVSSYLHWIPLSQTRKMFQSGNELWMEKK
ncbi:hypothetical protein ACOME3_007380 [Neoechinorhynchus agilis]